MNQALCYLGLEHLNKCALLEMEQFYAVFNIDS